MLSMPGGAVLLARVPAHGLEGAQAGVHGGTAMSVGLPACQWEPEAQWESGTMTWIRVPADRPSTGPLV